MSFYNIYIYILHRQHVYSSFQGISLHHLVAVSCSVSFFLVFDVDKNNDVAVRLLWLLFLFLFVFLLRVFAFVLCVPFAIIVVVVA